MDSPKNTRHQRYVSKAPPYEPALDEPCIASSARCRIGLRSSIFRSNHSSDGRQRPYPRSLGSHPSPGSGAALDTGDPSIPSPAQSSTPESAPTVLSPTAESEVPTDVRRGADHAMRLLLEVLDGRRAADQLKTWFAPTAVESIKTVVNTGSPGRRLGGATLRRVHSTRASNTTTELFATYARGPRVFAIAARIEHRSGPRKNSMTVTAVRVL